MVVGFFSRGRLSGGRLTPEKLEVTFDWINRPFSLSFFLFWFSLFVFCFLFYYFGSSLAELSPSRYASINDFPDLLLGILVVRISTGCGLRKE